MLFLGTFWLCLWVDICVKFMLHLKFNIQVAESRSVNIILNSARWFTSSLPEFATSLLHVMFKLSTGTTFLYSSSFCTNSKFCWRFYCLIIRPYNYVINSLIICFDTLDYLCGSFLLNFNKYTNTSSVFRQKLNV